MVPVLPVEAWTTSKLELPGTWAKRPARRWLSFREGAPYGAPSPHLWHGFPGAYFGLRRDPGRPTAFQRDEVAGLHSEDRAQDSELR